MSVGCDPSCLVELGRRNKMLKRFCLNVNLFKLLNRKLHALHSLSHIPHKAQILCRYLICKLECLVRWQRISWLLLVIMSVSLLIISNRHNYIQSELIVGTLIWLMGTEARPPQLGQDWQRNNVLLLILNRSFPLVDIRNREVQRVIIFSCNSPSVVCLAIFLLFNFLVCVSVYPHNYPLISRLLRIAVGRLYIMPTQEQNMHRGSLKPMLW